MAPGAPTGDTTGIVVSSAIAQFNHISDNDFSDFYGTNKNGIVVGTAAANNYIHDNSSDSSVTSTVVVAGDAGANNFFARNLPTFIQTFTANAATPSVGNDLNGQWNTANSSATTITNFLNGYTAQVFTVLVNDANTTFQHNANIIMRSGVNYAAPNGTILVFRRDATLWREVSRSV